MAPQFIAQTAPAANPTLALTRREYCVRRCVFCYRSNCSGKFRLCKSVDSRAQKAQSEQSTQSELDIPRAIQRIMASLAHRPRPIHAKEHTGNFRSTCRLSTGCAYLLGNARGSRGDRVDGQAARRLETRARPPCDDEQPHRGMPAPRTNRRAFPPDSRAAQQIEPK